MVKPILYGTLLSPHVRAVLLTVKAIGLDIDFREMNLLNKEHLSEDFLKKNPQHTVPVLEDEGKIIWDSHAIATYLIGKYGKSDSLYPKDLYQRALVDQRLHFDSGILFVRLRAIGEMIFFKNDPNIPKEKIDAVYEAYDLVEKFLDNGNFLVGNSLTVADFCCVATISILHGLYSLDPTKYPKVSAWMQRLAQLPYYQDANGNGAATEVNKINEKLNELRGK